jgi:hypothetical protein
LIGFFTANLTARKLETSMTFRFLLIAGLLLTAEPAFADWWIVRASDKKCLVVDLEPSTNDKDVTKVGEKVYQTREQAEADLKLLCNEKSPRSPGN